MSKLSPSSSSSRRMSHHPTPHTQQHHGGKHRIYSCACLNLIIHVSSPDTTGQGPADPPLSQHELKCFSTIFDSQQSIFLPSTSSQSTSPSSSLSSSTLTLSSSSTSLPSSLSPAGMSRSYSNSSLPAPHLGGSGSSESFIWGILEKQTIEHADLVTCRTVEGCPAWTLLHCGNCEMDVTAFKHNEYLTQHFRQHANLNINATPDITASTSTPAFTRTTCVLNGKCVYGEDVLRLRDSDDFSTAFGIIIHRHALSTPISSSPHQSSGLPAALLESSPKNTNATSTTVLGTSPSPSSSSSQLIPPTLEAHAAQAIANERILMEQRISKFTAAQMSAFQDFQRRTRNELDSLGNVCIEIARDGLTPLPLFSFAIGPRTARSYSKLQAQQRQSLINSINSIAARQTSPQHQHEDEEMISPKDTSPHRAESQSLPPFPPSRLRGQSIQALLTHAQNQSAAAAAASATRQSPTSPSSIDPTSPQSITSTTRTSITAEPTSSAHQASSRARGQSRNSRSSLVRLKIDEEQEDQDTKEVSDDDLLRDDSNKSISRNQTPSSSTIGIDDDRESGNGDDAQIFRFEEEETATAMSSQPYLRHDVVVSGEDNSEDENEADLFDDGTYDEPEGLSPTAAGASTSRAPVTPSKPQAQVTAGSGLFSPNTTQAQATLINTMNNTKSNVSDSSKSRFLSSSVPMAIPVQLQSAFTPMKNVAVDADDDEDDNPLSDDDEPQANPHVMGRSARTDRHGQLISSRRASLNVTIPDTTPPHCIGRSSRTSSTCTRAPQPARDSDDDDDAYTSPSRPEDLDVPAPRVSRRPHDDGDVEDDGVEDEDGEANPIIPPHTLVEEPFFSFAKSKHIAPMPTVSNAMRVTHHSPSTSTSTSTATPPMRIGNSSTSTSTSSSSRTSQPFSLPIRMTGPLGSKQFRRVDE